MAGPIDLSHPSRAELRDDLVGAEPRTGADGHGVALVYRFGMSACRTLACEVGRRCRSTRHAAVDCQLADVQPSHLKVGDAQGAHTRALQGERANGQLSDGKRTDRGGADG